MNMPRVDRETVRTSIQAMSVASLLMIIDRALDLMTDEQLHRMLDGHVEPKELTPTTRPPENLLRLARQFHSASLHGEYYEEQRPKSWSSMDPSRGTEQFTADCHRLLERCVSAVDQNQHDIAKSAFSLIFDVIRALGEGNDDILFFADEGGLWQLGIPWPRVLPMWFRCLAATADAPEFAESILAAIETYSFSTEREALVEIACEVGTEDQRSALLDAIEARA